jgi:protein-disulfide isomerase
MKNIKLVIIGLVSMVVLVGSVAVLLSRQAGTVTDKVVVEEGARQATVSGQLKGEPKVIIVEFSDFQCPACRLMSGLVRQMVNKYEGVGLIYRHFPINTIHRNAYKAAEASEVAGSLGKFWEYHDVLFARQDEWVEEKDIVGRLVSYAEEIGLSGEIFLEKLNRGEGAEGVQTDLALGRKIGIVATPTLFVNGEKVNGENLEEAIQKALKE